MAGFSPNLRNNALHFGRSLPISTSWTTRNPSQSGSWIHTSATLQISSGSAACLHLGTHAQSSSPDPTVAGTIRKTRGFKDTQLGKQIPNYHGLLGLLQLGFVVPQPSKVLGFPAHLQARMQLETSAGSAPSSAEDAATNWLCGAHRLSDAVPFLTEDFLRRQEASQCPDIGFLSL